MNETEWFEGRGTDEQHEECYWRRVAGWLILAALCVASLPIWGCSNSPQVQAQDEHKESLIIRRGQDYLRLAWTACNSLPSFRTGDAVLDGKAYKLCWKPMVNPSPHVEIIFEDGDLWRVNPAAFKPESQVPKSDV